MVASRLEQEVGRESKPPLGEEGHRRLSDESGEPTGERGTRHPGTRREPGHRPRLLGMVLHQSQRRTDDRIGLGGRTRRVVRIVGGRTRCAGR
jgi:hypothetical protein